MKAAPALVGYGIQTSKADYWVHVCPDINQFFYYNRARMLKLIEAKDFPRVDARSANGAITGRGYLIPIHCGIVGVVHPPITIIRATDWNSVTDAQAGILAEEAWAVAVELGYVPRPWLPEYFTTTAEQYEGKDFSISPARKFTVEVKCDRPLKQTGNLFVQIAEYKHDKAGVRYVKEAVWPD